MALLRAVLSGLVLMATGLLGQAFAANLTVAKSGGNESSPLLYGIMFEVRSHSSP